jgi:hypothetical protein
MTSMPTPPSKTKQRAGRNEERHRLHEAVDRILDGPDDRAMDAWVRQALVDLGFLVRVAAPALDYEVGRTISGVSRRHGNFPINLSWEGAELSVSSEQAKAWVAAGEAARYERLPSEIRQQALAALLHPIANISCHTWLHDLVIGFDALRFGHVTPLLQRSNRRLWGSVNAWRQRLDALRWVEFQIAAGKIKKGMMRSTVSRVNLEPGFTRLKDGANRLRGC